MSVTEWDHRELLELHGRVLCIAEGYRVESASGSLAIHLCPENDGSAHSLFARCPCRPARVLELVMDPKDADSIPVYVHRRVKQ